MAVPASPIRVLILCTGNSARSQIAEGLLRHDSHGAIEVESAGVAPSSLRQEAVDVMKEIGIDISNRRSKSVDEFVGQRFDYIITVCDNAKEVCPIFPGAGRNIHHSFADPPPPHSRDDIEMLAIFRRLRDDIRHWFRRTLIAGEDTSHKSKD